MERYIQEHILHCLYWDLFGSMMVDCMSSQSLGILKSLMMLLDDLGQAIENPSCEAEEPAAQECYMVGFFLSSLTGSQCACVCCDSLDCDL